MMRTGTLSSTIQHTAGARRILIQTACSKATLTALISVGSSPIIHSSEMIFSTSPFRVTHPFLTGQQQEKTFLNGSSATGPSMTGRCPILLSSAFRVSDNSRMMNSSGILKRWRGISTYWIQQSSELSGEVPG